MSQTRLFGSLCAMVFLVNLSRIVFAPLLQPVASDFGVATASLGIIASAAWLGSALSRLPTGYVLTRVPRHRVVIATGTILVVTSAFTGLAQSITHLAVGAFLMGLSSGIYFIAANPLVSELFPQYIGRAIGIHGTSSQIAAVSAPLILGGVLLVADWRAVFFIIAAGALFATLAVTIASTRADLPQAGLEDRSLMIAVRAQWRIIVTGIFIMGTVGFLWNGLFNLYGDYLETVKGLTPATGRLFLSLMFAAGVPAWFIAGSLADRWHPIPLMAALLLTFAAGVVGLTAADELLLIAAFSGLIGYLFFSLIPVLDTYLLSNLPDQHRSSSYAWYSSSMMIIIAFGSGVIGTVVALGSGYDTVFRVLALGIAFIGASVLILFHAQKLPADTSSSHA